jgi:hypothetical protein
MHKPPSEIQNAMQISPHLNDVGPQKRSTSNILTPPRTFSLSVYTLTSPPYTHAAQYPLHTSTSLRMNRISSCGGRRLTRNADSGRPFPSYPSRSNLYHYYPDHSMNSMLHHRDSNYSSVNESTHWRGNGGKRDKLRLCGCNNNMRQRWTELTSLL